MAERRRQIVDVVDAALKADNRERVGERAGFTWQMVDALRECIEWAENWDGDTSQGEPDPQTIALARAAVDRITELLPARS